MADHPEADPDTDLRGSTPADAEDSGTPPRRGRSARSRRRRPEPLPVLVEDAEAFTSDLKRRRDLHRRSRSARQFLRDVNYPHAIHPALVPGVSVEDQKVRYGIDKGILVVVGVLIIAFVTWGVSSPQTVFEVSGVALDWVMVNLGWMFNVLAIGMVLLLLLLAFTRYGRIPLGLDGEKPEYGTASWAAMLFAAGIGIGIIFFGPYEPLTYYLQPRPGAGYDANSIEAMKGAIAQSALHWGLNAWAIYAIVGLSVAYISYRRGRVPLMSSIVTTLWGGTRSDTIPARIIDALAIIATLFGTAASLGIGAMQIARGTEIVSGIGETGNTVALLIISVLTAGTIASAVSGVARGIRRLSNINMVLSVGLAVFFFVLGPTVFLVNIIPGAVVEYFGTLPEMLAANMSEGEDMQAFLSSWTTFYWAWWVSWSPFVGVFVAKISRGRTIRQFILGVLLIPSSIIVLAFAILGGTAIWIQRQATLAGETGLAIAPDGTTDSMPLPAEIFYAVVEQIPGGGILSVLVIAILAIFFITTADSASLVNSQMSQKGNPEPNRLITAFWVLCMAGIAVVILLFGGEDALQGLQNLIVVTALPFAVIIVLMAIALVRELRNDPQTIRDHYEDVAVRNAVKHGVKEYGDNFALTIEPTTAGDEYATGQNFDSTAPEVTEWYTRTDEEGNPVGYDYEAGQYIPPGSTDGRDEGGDQDDGATDQSAEPDESGKPGGSGATGKAEREGDSGAALPPDAR